MKKYYTNEENGSLNKLTSYEMGEPKIKLIDELNKKSFEFR